MVTVATQRGAPLSSGTSRKQATHDRVRLGQDFQAPRYAHAAVGENHVCFDWTKREVRSRSQGSFPKQLF